MGDKKHLLIVGTPVPGAPLTMCGADSMTVVSELKGVTCPDCIREAKSAGSTAQIKLAKEMLDRVADRKARRKNELELRVDELERRIAKLEARLLGEP